MYSTTPALTSALDGVDAQRYAPAALPPGMTRYTLYRVLDGPQGRSTRVQEILPPPQGTGSPARPARSESIPTEPAHR